MTPVDLKNIVRQALGSSIEGTIVAAVSGGPDSMAMFHALCELSKEYTGLRVVAGHFDHQLRPDSERDLEVVIRMAERFGVEVIYDRVDVGLRAMESGRSVETTARVWRYTFLASVAGGMGATRIATAHTRDDQVETVLMRILRGAEARGLRGVSERDGAIVRPLLSVTHAETIRYCETHDIPYVTDPSNEDRRYFRNHVRHEVLPSLRRVYPGIDEALLRVRESALREFADAERAIAGRLAKWVHVEYNTCRIAPEAFDGLEDDHRLHVIARVVDALRIEDVTGAHYRAMLAGSAVDLPGWHVRSEHDGLVFRRRAEPTTFTPRPIAVPGVTLVPGWTFTSDAIGATQAREELLHHQGNVALLAAAGPFTVRLPRPGDRIRPLGMRGHKKLSDLFIDRKVPRRERSRIPVVEAGGEIVWVVGVAVSEAVRVRGDEKAVVRLSAVRQGVVP